MTKGGTLTQLLGLKPLKTAGTVLVAAVVLIGTPRFASAQVDLTGIWAPIFHEDQVERVPGPEVGDYAGLPINDAVRLRADTWDASLLTLPEHQCKPHPSTYGFRGVGNLRITPVYDDATQQMIKLNTHIQWQEQEREIWMDGRPHPPDYRGAHLAGLLDRRSGTATCWWSRPRTSRPAGSGATAWRSATRRTMTERFIRHGNYLTHVYMIEDPVLPDRAADQDQRLPADRPA